MNFGVILLAAGGSRRMGRPKLLLPWGAISILGHQIHLWQQLRVRQLTVVCATGDTGISTELDRLHFQRSDRIQNPQPDLGMFSSIVCAAQWNGWAEGLTHWVITLGDQPHLRLETLRALLDFSATHPDRICQPRSLGHLRHPVILPGCFFQQIKRTAASSLKVYLRSCSESVAGCALDDPGLDFDVDTPADYEKAIAPGVRAS